ncbi:MAG: ribosomal-processing cysteine protease Prp [Eubacteriales bacterium]|nr:ribosomal-processing cysteine protease Prp [Eubacteriales bacterium]
MIKVDFFGTSPVLGFYISGHADYSQVGSDIVCAAVSSAAYMTANTVTDIIKATPKLRVNDGEMYLKLEIADAHKCSSIMKGFVLHMLSLAEQYKQYITVTISEV